MRVESVEVKPRADGGMLVIEDAEGSRLTTDAALLTGQGARPNIFINGGGAGYVKRTQDVGREALDACFRKIEGEHEGVYELLPGATLKIANGSGAPNIIDGPARVIELVPPQQ